MISPLAYIDPEAKIGENVEIGPFVFIDKNVVIGDNNVIMPNANILYGSRIGNGNRIFPGAVIGAIPQDLKFHGEETTAEIGDRHAAVFGQDLMQHDLIIRAERLTEILDQHGILPEHLFRHGETLLVRCSVILILA